jgi:hypothetical protein
MKENLISFLKKLCRFWMRLNNKLSNLITVYKITLWSNWIEEVANASADFFTTFDGLIPNVLEANSHTFSQFEFIATLAPIGNNLINIDSQKSATQTDTPIIRELTFKDEFTLCFIQNEEIQDKCFILNRQDLNEIKKLLNKK